MTAGKRLKKMLDDLEHLTFYGEERLTWKAAVVEWAVEASRNVKPSTFERYRLSLKKLRPDLDQLYLDEVTRKVVAKAAGRQGVSNATRRRDLTAMSSVLRFCVAKGYREDNPAKEWDRSAIRERRDPIRLPAHEDVEAVIALAPGNFARMIEAAWRTGMREEEIAGMERRQIRLKDRAVDLWQTKTNRPRTVPLDETAAGTFSGTPAHLHSKWVFWHDDGERYRNIASRFAALCKRAVDKELAERRFRFHDLRHLYAVDYLRGGGSIYDLQQILGHASIKTTEIYLDFLTPDQQKQAKYGSAQKPAQ